VLGHLHDLSGYEIKGREAYQAVLTFSSKNWLTFIKSTYLEIRPVFAQNLSPQAQCKQRTMTDRPEPEKNKALHELMEEEFQQLVDVIEQKQIVHEEVSFRQDDEADPITRAAQQLQQQSQELGAETLAEFFYELEHSARSGVLDSTSELLDQIHGEFENVRDILADD
jgi:hypothetical protein